jgi:hypothetical protein
MHHSILSQFQQEQLLAFFKNHMSQETRAAVMTHLPQAYNAWHNETIVEVHYTDEDRTDRPKAPERGWHC